jgi:hypothetical protein
VEIADPGAETGNRSSLFADTTVEREETKRRREVEKKRRREEEKKRRREEEN